MSVYSPPGAGYGPPSHLHGGAELVAHGEPARVVEAAAGGLTLFTWSGRRDLSRATTCAVAAQVNTALIPFYVF